MFSSFNSQRHRKTRRFLPFLEELETRAVPSTYLSTNWSGYGVETNFNSPASYAVTQVAGTWTVPTVINNTSLGWSSTWVGIDGFSSSTVEQLGTEQDTSATATKYGMPQYYAWYEMYPAFPVLISSVPISPGNSITASVTYTGIATDSVGTFTLSITNNTTGASFSTTQTLITAQRSSAEWIEEAPSSGSVLPLADFQTVSFTGATTTVSGVGPSPISNFPNASINMITSSGRLLDSTSALNATGDGFTINYVGSTSGGGGHHRHSRFTTMQDGNLVAVQNMAFSGSVSQTSTPVFLPVRPNDPVFVAPTLSPNQQTPTFPGYLIVMPATPEAPADSQPKEDQQGSATPMVTPPSQNGENGPAGPMSTRAVDDFFAGIARDQNQFEETPVLGSSTAPVIDVATGAEISFLILGAYLGNPIKAKETEDHTKRKVKWL
jgi:hypothetical protein